MRFVQSPQYDITNMKRIINKHGEYLSTRKKKKIKMFFMLVNDNEILMKKLTETARSQSSYPLPAFLHLPLNTHIKYLKNKCFV